MPINEIPFEMIGLMMIPVVWMWIGIGASKMISKIKDRQINMIEVLFWPVAVMIFACCDDIN